MHINNVGSGDAYQIALAGMRRAEEGMMRGAALILNEGHIAEGMMEMSLAKTQYGVSVKVFQLLQEMDRSLLDIFA
ncbi:MAG: hypothetical protein IH944_05030 [Armatimonadetes bacterium]|nr:hypothetical protein [Armatimonadota bacterium]